MRRQPQPMTGPGGWTRKAMIARFLVVLAAFAGCAWFAMGARQAHELNAATAQVQSSRALGPAALARVESRLHDAALLNPDREVEIARATALDKAGQPAGARAILEPVTRAEPMNLAAWLALGRSSAGDPQEFRRALAAIVKLDPPVRHRS